MELDRNRWCVRLFFWSLWLWMVFSDNYSRWSNIERNGTNLCFFVRVIIFYMSFVLCLHAALLVLAVASVTVVPVYLFGISYYLKGLGVIVIGLAIIYIVRIIIAKKIKQEVSVLPKPIITAPTTVKKVRKGPTFRQLLWAWLKANKDKICPLITFSDQEVHNG